MSEFLSANDYHKLPGVSNSMLSVLIEDPRKYYYQFLSGQYVPVRKDYFDFGSAVHDICLRGDHSGIIEIPSSVLSKNGSRAGSVWKEFEAENSDKLLLKASDYDAVMRCVEAVFNHPIAGDILKSTHGEAEVMHQAEVGGLLLRCRPDWLCEWKGLNIVVDLKTTTDTTPDKFAKSVANFGYHRQEYFYSMVLEACGIEVDGFVFIAVNDSPPHCVDVYELNADWRSIAADEVDRALADLQRRIATNDWTTGTENSVVPLAPPNWMKFKTRTKEAYYE